MVQSVALQENGVPKNGAKMMCLTLEIMQFCPRAGFLELKTSLAAQRIILLWLLGKEVD